MMAAWKRVAGVVLAAGLLGGAGAAAQETKAGQNTIQPESAEKMTATPVNVTDEELLTATVHQAWLLSGKNEATFFEMVAKLAAISAKNRGIELPDTEAAGEKMGAAIKASARADTDQLLYAVVDRAVRNSSNRPVHVAGAKR